MHLSINKVNNLIIFQKKKKLIISSIKIKTTTFLLGGRKKMLAFLLYDHGFANHARFGRLGHSHPHNWKTIILLTLIKLQPPLRSTHLTLFKWDLKLFFIFLFVFSLINISHYLVQFLLNVFSSDFKRL